MDSLQLGSQERITGHELVIGRGDSSFSRGLRVLLAFGSGSRRSVQEVAEGLELPLSTVYRYVRELRRFRLVDEAEPGVYAAGPGLLGLALGAPLQAQLRLHGLPSLERLAAATGETAMLTMRVDLSALVVAQVESPQPMRLSFVPGTLRPLHAGASAIVLLAYEPPALVRRVLERPLEQFTERTIQSSERLLKRLEEIRRSGYAVSTEEVDPFATAVAAPVLVNGRLLCCLSIAGPTARFDEGRVQKSIDLVMAEAERISRMLTNEDDGA